MINFFYINDIICILYIFLKKIDAQLNINHSEINYTLAVNQTYQNNFIIHHIFINQLLKHNISRKKNFLANQICPKSNTFSIISIGMLCK